MIKPSNTDIQKLSDTLGFSLSEEELEQYRNLVIEQLGAYETLAGLEDELTELKYPRGSWRFPSKEENKLNAWYVKCEIEGSSEGKLAGKTIAIKDNMCVGGIPCMNGASFLEGFVPEVDATVVERVLDAGATIKGKASCEYLCFSGGSHTNYKGPIRNPHNPEYSAGGSSSGCAVLLAKGEVDLAIGADQGGSIRIPSSWSGCVGLKPTWGLVPYTGIFSVMPHVDHAGPMSRTVEDNALLLEVLAGDDFIDSRQGRGPREPIEYSTIMKQGVKGLRIAIVNEGFTQKGYEEDVNEKVLEAVSKLEELGAEVERIDIPFHQAEAFSIWFGVHMEGFVSQLLNGDITDGLYVPSLIQALNRYYQHGAKQCPDTVKVIGMAALYAKQTYGTMFFAKSMNLARKLRDRYTSILENYDMLVMPTTPMKSQPIPPKDTSKSDFIFQAFRMVLNTCVFDATGHPAISVPCGFSDGLPIGMMLVGKYYDEGTLYRAAYAYEQSQCDQQ